MLKKKVGLIGKGNWGSRLKLKLIRNADLKFVCGKQKNYQEIIKKNKIDWVFIATPNKTHFKIVKNCLKNNINVFCEKPLCHSANKAKKLFDIAKKKNLKLHVSDLYNFYNKKVKKLNFNNTVFRSKYVKGNDNEFFSRFMYHDISILYELLKKIKIKSCTLKQEKKKKLFRLIIEFNNKKEIIFIYNLNSHIKKHIINNKIIASKKDYLNKMVINVLNNKYDISQNNKKALFIIKYIEQIKKKMKYAN